MEGGRLLLGNERGKMRENEGELGSSGRGAVCGAKNEEEWEKSESPLWVVLEKKMKKKKWERKTKGKKIKNKKPNRKFRGMGLERGVMGVGKGR